MPDNALRYVHDNYNCFLSNVLKHMLRRMSFVTKKCVCSKSYTFFGRIVSHQVLNKLFLLIWRTSTYVDHKCKTLEIVETFRKQKKIGKRKQKLSQGEKKENTQHCIGERRGRKESGTVVKRGDKVEYKNVEYNQTRADDHLWIA